jgi:hypothetical protein
MVLSLEIHHCRSSNHGEAFRVQGGMERMRDADCAGQAAYEKPCHWSSEWGTENTEDDSAKDFWLTLPERENGGVNDKAGSTSRQPLQEKSMIASVSKN